jgi:hypothetical protein
MKNKLYIIGNGFDLHHNLKTSYYNFRDYLKNHNREIYDLLEQYLCCSDDLWGDFEESLAKLDTDELYCDNSNLLPNIESDDFREHDWYVFPDEMERIYDKLTTELVETFKDFISEAMSVDDLEILKHKIDVDINARFLCFNYTDTLERIYHIQRKNINYIHNSIKDSSENIILGHSIDPSKFILKIKDEDYYYPYDEGRLTLNNYFETMHKPTGKIIEENRSYFNSLSNTNKIYVLGHSISKVDIPYFEKIVQIINRNVEWILSYYKEEEIETFKNTLKNIGVSSKINFVRLEDLKK